MPDVCVASVWMPLLDAQLEMRQRNEVRQAKLREQQALQKDVAAENKAIAHDFIGGLPPRELSAGPPPPTSIEHRKNADTGKWSGELDGSDGFDPAFVRQGMSSVADQNAKKMLKEIKTEKFRKIARVAAKDGA